MTEDRKEVLRTLALWAYAVFVLWLISCSPGCAALL